MRHRVTRVQLTLIALLAAVGVLAAGADGASSSDKTASPVARPACGLLAGHVLANSAGEVATRIYGGELSGSETRSDQHQVESYGPLLEAVSSGDSAAIQAAVTSLVYSHTHIVRLRVTNGSSVLADVGGPYIIAPVGGSLRMNGRTIAHYVLSVQDDLGYVKLVTRFLGVPILLRVGSQQLPIEGTPMPGPASIPANGPVIYRHVSYQAFSFGARSFPGGPLRVSLLVPVPKSLSAETCGAIKSGELGRAALMIAQRFTLTPSSFSTYVKFVSTLTHGLLYIRSGSKQLAGSTPRGPAKLPSSGSVRYRGRTYEVFSFNASSSSGSVRISQLVTV
ncbi:MAG TPA: hypothetical protein VHT29_14065 [Solirubrobacteraceae bacterium]|jgi:hypothetical protein|nr:hypothetical protein [Solirubrobacteraceae bacterium]